jgi:hypothetical protein
LVLFRINLIGMETDQADDTGWLEVL